MDLWYRKHLTARLGAQTAVWTFRDEGCAENVADIYVRASLNIYYHRERYMGELPELSLLCLQAYKMGILSPRPYHQQLPRDASMFYCVLASFTACCAAWNLDALELLKTADPSACISLGDLTAIREQARWEGAAFPGTWDGRAIEWLGESLDALDCSDVSAQLIARTLHGRRC